MSTAPHTRLNASLGWPETARLLELPFCEPTLPARGPCPLCPHGTMTIYEDLRDGGAWFSCRDCKRSGDLIELAAALWGMDLPATLNRLLRLGAPLPPEGETAQGIEGYRRDYPGYRQRFLALWAHAQERLLVRSPTLAALRDRLHLHSSLIGERWHQGPGKLLGALAKEEVEACFCPASTGQGGGVAPERYRLNPSAGRVFAGRDWSEVLAVPYADLPGRICAWEFIGRQGTAADRVFRPLRQRSRSGSNQHQPQPPLLAEAGLAGLSTVEDADPHWGNTVFAVADGVLALRLQLRHFLVSLRPLPLVCWYSGPRARTQHAWKTLADRAVLFWSARLDALVLWQACQADGSLILAGPQEQTKAAWDHYLRQHEPGELLRRLRKRAVPWREVLRQWAEDKPEGVVRELLIGLESCGADVPQLVQECGGGRLEELLPQKQARSLLFGSRRIIERADGWYVAQRRGGESLLLNAILRIDRIRSVGEELEYQGRIVFRGEEVAFVVAGSAWERQPARWLRQYLLQQGKGVLQFAPGIRDLLEIALRFQEPVVG